MAKGYGKPHQLVGGARQNQEPAEQQRNKRVPEHEFHEVTSFQHDMLDWQRTASVLSFGKSQPARSVLFTLLTSPARVPDCSPRQTGNEHRFVEVFTNSFVEVLFGWLLGVLRLPRVGKSLVTPGRYILYAATVLL